jgi:hypothetical protein
MRMRKNKLLNKYDIAVFLYLLGMIFMFPLIVNFFIKLILCREVRLGCIYTA